MGVHQTTGNVQPQPSALSHRALSPPVGLEDPRQLGLRDTGAAVRDADAHLSIRLLGSDDDVLPLLGVNLMALPTRLVSSRMIRARSHRLVTGCEGSEAFRRTAPARATGSSASSTSRMMSATSSRLR
jgi:hypothetical protein